MEVMLLIAGLIILCLLVLAILLQFDRHALQRELLAERQQFANLVAAGRVLGYIHADKIAANTITTDKL